MFKKNSIYIYISDSQRCFHAPACYVKTWSLSKLQQRHEIEEKPHSKYRGDSAAPEDERCTSSTPSGTVCGAHFAAAQVTNSSVVLANSRRAEAEADLSQRVRVAAGPIVTDSSRSVTPPILCTESRRYEQSAAR